MARLEYRLYDEKAGYPALYHYNRIDLAEISARFACDYLIKEGKVLETQSCSASGGEYVIYVTEATDEEPLPPGSDARTARGMTIELREFREGAIVYPLLGTIAVKEPEVLALHLQSTFLVHDGREWEKTSAEVDEDRGVFVYYMQEVKS